MKTGASSAERSGGGSEALEALVDGLALLRKSVEKGLDDPGELSEKKRQGGGEGEGKSQR